ncbi:rhodanese-like domain-containing protein [Hutsoniella sourekii]|uniref:rhodanese-like domain-containing protein n=1 Tax=Hutsoniella sourekii TaxID=87650 RepID=UPI0004819004|nr:rhodanese-like domain-containing protein [Hutsoniella sourekii]
MSLIYALMAILVIASLAYGIYYLTMLVMRKRSAEMVNQYELAKDIRRVQVIDVREEPEFNAKHILGARNIPSSQFKLRLGELRKDKPIYLYDDDLTQASRAANQLRKAGYSEIYILEDGFESWTGKTKSNI